MGLEINTFEPHMSNLAYIQNKVLDIIIQNFDDKASSCVSIDSNFSEVDSITFIKIVVALETEFDFEFDDEMLLINNFPTVKSMVEYVMAKGRELDKNCTIYQQN